MESLLYKKKETITNLLYFRSSPRLLFSRCPLSPTTHLLYPATECTPPESVLHRECTPPSLLHQVYSTESTPPSLLHRVYSVEEYTPFQCLPHLNILFCQCFPFSNFNIFLAQCPPLLICSTLYIFSSQSFSLSMFILLNIFPLNVFPFQCLHRLISSLVNVFPSQISISPPFNVFPF